jgi:MSHA biogenesis protein MshN
MSVINKVLRDLDSRQQASLSVKTVKTIREGADDLTVGTLAIGAGGTRVWHWRFVLLVVLVLSLMVAGYAGWWWLQKPVTVTTVNMAPVPAVAPALPASAPDLVPKPDREMILSTPVTTLATAVTTKPVLTVSAPASTPRPATANSPPAVAAAPGVSGDQVSSVPLTLKLSSQTLHSQSPASAPAATGPVVPAVSVAPVAIAPAVLTASKAARPSTQELVAQAQALWNEGSHGAAAALLKAAMVQLESAPADVAPDTASAALLVREYARVTLASGQVSETLATLERLGPRLAGVADIWAIRANAAQRLGQHTQAVTAYQKALALQPGEPRWMLGAAVSMAAMGQTGPAAELAEKARMAKALPPDVANYLRQLGVTIRSD